MQIRLQRSKRNCVLRAVVCVCVIVRSTLQFCWNASHSANITNATRLSTALCKTWGTFKTNEISWNYKIGQLNV